MLLLVLQATAVLRLCAVHWNVDSTIDGNELAYREVLGVIKLQWDLPAFLHRPEDEAARVSYSCKFTVLAGLHHSKQPFRYNAIWLETVLQHDMMTVEGDFL